MHGVKTAPEVTVLRSVLRRDFTLPEILCIYFIKPCNLLTLYNCMISVALQIQWESVPLYPNSHGSLGLTMTEIWDHKHLLFSVFFLSFLLIIFSFIFHTDPFLPSSFSSLPTSHLAPPHLLHSSSFSVREGAGLSGESTKHGRSSGGRTKLLPMAHQDPITGTKLLPLQG